MKIVRIETPISAGQYSKSSDWAKLRDELQREVCHVEWPEGTGTFTIRPIRKGNGVKPIKDGFVAYLKSRGWKTEEPMALAAATKPGNIDAVLYSVRGTIALEWETGNISSSHRALNKMSLGLLKGKLIAGVLVVPSRNMYRYLTDRIGNFDEIEPYLDLWASLPCKEGVLEIIVIEQDAVSDSVPLIPKGTDGRALV